MFRYRALALESDWDEFGYTDASDIEIESDILELGDDYEPEESLDDLPLRSEPREVPVPAGRLMKPAAGGTVLPSQLAGPTKGPSSLQTRETPRDIPSLAAGRAVSVASAPPSLRPRSSAGSAVTRQSATVPTAASPKKKASPTAHQGRTIANPLPARKSPVKEKAPQNGSSKNKGKPTPKVAVPAVANPKSAVKPAAKGQAKAAAAKPAAKKPAAKNSAVRPAPAKSATAPRGGATKTVSKVGVKLATETAKSNPKAATKKPPVSAKGAPTRSAAAKVVPAKKASAKSAKPAANPPKPKAKAVKPAAKPVPARNSASGKPSPKKAAAAKRKR